MRILAVVGILGLALRFYSANASTQDQPKQAPIPVALGAKGWQFVKEDPKTRKKLAVIHAKSFEITSSPFVFRLNGVTGQLYNPLTSSYSNLSIKAAFIDEKSGALIDVDRLTVIQIP